VSYVKVQPFMEDLKLVLLTHSHGDHFKPSTARRMAMEKPKLRFGCAPFMAKPLVDAGVLKKQIVIMKPYYMYGFGICNVIPFEVEHDVLNVGYKIHFPNCKVFYATDCANLRGISAKGYDLYMCEANFQKDELKARMDAKKDQGLYAYEQRVLRCHMSKEDCDDWLVKQMGPHSEYVYLHCHKEKQNEG
jgi:phosphoribosyl 1,2-cyclic phosphodiesterase